MRKILLCIINSKDLWQLDFDELFTTLIITTIDSILIVVMVDYIEILVLLTTLIFALFRFELLGT